jgi:bifunctional non-homologous end joining protein LigD
MEGFPQKTSIVEHDHQEAEAVKPMLAKTGDTTVLDRPGYIYEPKLDGIRALLHYGKNPSFESRNGKDLTSRFSGIKVPRLKADSCVVDGEIVAYDQKGNPDFNLLQNNGDAVFVAFDILEKDGASLRAMPLKERKKILRATIRENATMQLMVYTEDGRTLWTAMKKRGTEGVIAKKKDSVYQEGVRSESWIKIKFTKTIDAVVIGFSHARRRISSLALGLYDRRHLVFIGKVGTGFDEGFIERFWPQLQRIMSEKNTGLLPADITAVRPRYVAEIEYLEFTPDQKLRAPVFKRLREDKKPSECTFSQ